MPQDAVHGSVSAPFRMDLSDQDAQTQEMLKSSVAQLPISWITPSGWSETKGSGMRVATFTTPSPENIECTIVALTGDAGGVVNNVLRWLQQLGIGGADPDMIHDWIKTSPFIEAKEGLSMPLLDFSEWQNEAEGDAPSMIATILEQQGNAIFIKMTGTKAAVAKNKSSFQELCRSITLTNE